MANIILDIEKGIKVGCEDALKFLAGAQGKAPAAVAAMGVLAGAVDKALTDVAAGASNPTTLVLNFKSDIADVKAVWPGVKTFLATLGIEV